VKQQTVVNYIKKYEISNACSHTEGLVFENADKTTASVIALITAWEYITSTKLHIVLPFCRVSIVTHAVRTSSLATCNDIMTPELSCTRRRQNT
jgi:hypothetical protein